MNILRIADISTYNRAGGMPRYMYFIADELRNAGHQIDLVFQDELPCRANGPVRRLAAPRAVVRLVKERLKQGRRYDVVDVHEPIAAAYALARRLTSWLPPLLVCVYGLEARGRKALLGYRRKKGLPISWRQQLSPLLTVLQANFALRNADHVTVETVEDADYLRARLGVSADRISFLHGAANLEFFQDNSTVAGILFVGTWIERKGILDLIPALIRVLEKHPSTPVTLAGVRAPQETILASFPSQFRATIRVVHSIANDQEMSKLYRGHNIFLLPSVFEGQPLAFLEAAAAGLAIVTTNTCGMKDFIRDGENGLLVEAGEPDALARCIFRLIEDPGLASRLGAAAREKALAFSWRRSAEQFLAAAQTALVRSNR